MRVPDRKPQTRAELIADGVVHGVGLTAGVAGSLVLLIVAALSGETRHIVAAAVYAFGLLAMLSASAAYNMLRNHPRRGILRGLDHSAIYVMIAGSYTPFLTALKEAWALGLTGSMWVLAAIGILIKMAIPNIHEGLSIAFYLVLGWLGLVAIWPLTETLSQTTLILLAVGGVIYSVGVIFHVAEKIPFSNAIWHAFVLGAAVVHYVAVIGTVQAS
jgi:hemolysin III